MLHFDAHPDTWNPVRYSAYWTSDQSRFNHGSFFHTASHEGLISSTSSAHAGLRTRLTGLDDGDYSNPGPGQGFLRIHADEIDDVGTPEPGGWTTRELIRILRGIKKLNLVGADIVEVSPSYDTAAETTALAAA